MRELLLETVTALLDDYAVGHAFDATIETSESQLCCVLGFTGDAMTGSVVVAATADAVAASNPVPSTGSAMWLAELTNQLVGRFKNQLLRRGVDVSMSVPVVLSATRLVPILQRAIAPIRLTVASGDMTVYLEVEGDLTLDLPDESAVLREGEALLF
ncbi:MAG TPA: hypothetical protein VGC41_03610 [Kofleriaceae bacterium]